MSAREGAPGGGEHPLRERLGLGRRAPAWTSLGRWPTPLTSLSLGGPTIWLKREDLSHPRYGGNKVRTLEMLLGDAAARGVTRVWAAGAYGSNHAVATLVHAPAAKLTAGALLFPQPYSDPAAENLRASASLSPQVEPVRSVATLPFAMLATWRSERIRGERPWMMPPGGATPLGALGALSAAFELAEQVRAGLAPAPATIVLPAGSVCTSSGLLAGLALAHRLGVWRWARPTVCAVRVTPWPVTSRARITGLALRALALVDRLRGSACGIQRGELGAHLVVDGAQLGAGYGRATTAGDAAAARFTASGGPSLDCVYAAKAGAALLARLERPAPPGPMLLWSTKSTAPPPTGTVKVPIAAPFARWLARC
ncbi:MAG: pyridoxal-phosphate dependent enzyme [Kofleriaceae bacterium]